MLTKIVLRWHFVRARYFNALFESCLDPTLKKKLELKLNYHLDKMIELKSEASS
ncbi:hypothetical protein IMZ08_05090 [Bacillus luteolus]|uniref:Uncharacterized protein n=1 Tax=Litchfieldia luteola TaxID=682179 RepID=A0ABR9QG37_9BACI|nr:hypothetical protein [Cytobacillus luteolus]MBE4907438.1 hypothetical protein [Cytobacillus luteolus]MBP1944204.1 hypothetical protein [Cytobacillus luteolus]